MGSGDATPGGRAPEIERPWASVVGGGGIVCTRTGPSSGLFRPARPMSHLGIEHASPATMAVGPKPNGAKGKGKKIIIKSPVYTSKGVI